MASKNAAAILPENLILEIQKYVQGETIYIPKQKARYKKWGTCTGTRKWIDDRNRLIKLAFQQGKTIDSLADEYFLSIESIKRIVYSN